MQNLYRKLIFKKKCAHRLLSYIAFKYNTTNSLSLSFKTMDKNVCRW